MTPDDSQCEYLFAYGTLQPGRAPQEIAPIVERLQIAARGYVQGTLYDFGHYPGAVLDAASTNRISGTIYKLPPDEDVLRQLDEYEEYFPDLPEKSQFVRRLHPVHRDDERTIPCWVYVLNEKSAARS